RLERLAAGIAAGEAAQLGLDEFELLVERDDQRQHHVDLCTHARVELERDHPTSPFSREQTAAAAGPAFVCKQRMQALRPTGAVVHERFTQPRLVAKQL